MSVKRIKTANKILIFIILSPVFLFGLNLFIELNHKPNLMNVTIYAVTLLLIFIGMVLINLTQKSNTSLILVSILAFLGIFGTSYFALFVLKDVSSLVFVGIILIPIILVLKNDEAICISAVLFMLSVGSKTPYIGTQDW